MGKDAKNINMTYMSILSVKKFFNRGSCQESNSKVYFLVIVDYPDCKNIVLIVHEIFFAQSIFLFKRYARGMKMLSILRSSTN